MRSHQAALEHEKRIAKRGAMANQQQTQLYAVFLSWKGRQPACRAEHWRRRSALQVLSSHARHWISALVTQVLCEWKLTTSDGRLRKTAKDVSGCYKKRTVQGVLTALRQGCQYLKAGILLIWRVRVLSMRRIRGFLQGSNAAAGKELVQLLLTVLLGWCHSVLQRRGLNLVRQQRTSTSATKQLALTRKAMLGQTALRAWHSSTLYGQWETQSSFFRQQIDHVSERTKVLMSRVVSLQGRPWYCSQWGKRVLLLGWQAQAAATSQLSLRQQFHSSLEHHREASLNAFKRRERTHTAMMRQTLQEVAFLLWKQRAANTKRHAVSTAQLKAADAAQLLILVLGTWHAVAAFNLRSRTLVELDRTRTVSHSRATAMLLRLAASRALVVKQFAFLTWRMNCLQRDFANDVVLLQQRLLFTSALGRERVLRLTIRNEESWCAALAHCVFLTWQLCCMAGLQEGFRMQQLQLSRCFANSMAISCRLARCRGQADVRSALLAWRFGMLRWLAEEQRARAEARGLAERVLLNWRLMCLAQREAGQALRLQHEARIAMRAVASRRHLAGMAACRQMLHAWQRHSVKVRCVREVQLVEYEKDRILLELSNLRDDRHRSQRDPISNLERSMSAALARAFEAGRPVAALPVSVVQHPQLLPG